MNVKLSYLYRDGANYKNYNEVVFSNPSLVPIDFITCEFQKYLIDRLWFYADKWYLPDLHFTEYSWDPYIDHEWHEFETLEETLEPTTENISIEEFLAQI